MTLIGNAPGQRVSGAIPGIAGVGGANGDAVASASEELARNWVAEDVLGGGWVEARVQVVKNRKVLPSNPAASDVLGGCRYCHSFLYRLVSSVSNYLTRYWRN